MTPEQIHLAINHLPIFGSGLAAIPILVGFFLRNKATLITGLAIAAAAGWTTGAVMYTGEAAYERYEEGPVRVYLDAQAHDALETHEHRAEDWAPILYSSALLSTIALGVALWRFSVGRWFSLVAALLCIASLATGMWIAESGGKIRRPDFRGAGLSLPR